MLYSQKALEEIENEFLRLPAATLAVQEAFYIHPYSRPEGREYGIHGVGRRFGFLRTCITNLFDSVPPDQDSPPAEKNLNDAIINLHAFIINTFGAIDNLAWVWVYERLTKEGKKPLPRIKVGLRAAHAGVVASLSQPFAEFLISLEPWFTYLEDFRHSLAHRIPLYIPPYTVPDHLVETHQELELRRREALRRGDTRTYKKLGEQQQSIAGFSPVMIHSFTDKNTGPVPIHQQVLRDFKTVEQLSWRMLQELKESA